MQCAIISMSLIMLNTVAKDIKLQAIHHLDLQQKFVQMVQVTQPTCLYAYIWKQEQCKWGNALVGSVQYMCAVVLLCIVDASLS